QGPMTGVNTSGGALVSNDRVTGLNVGGLAIVGNDGVDGVNVSLGAVESGNAIRGLTVGGFRVKAPNVQGVSGRIIMARTRNLDGLAIAGYNEVRGVQTGITIGIFNTAEVLNGIQIGLLNHAANNPPPFRWLPILNVHFD